MTTAAQSDVQIDNDEVRVTEMAAAVLQHAGQSGGLSTFRVIRSPRLRDLTA